MATSFPFTDNEFHNRIQTAVEGYWGVRLNQARRQHQSGRHDAGTRGEVTGGKQLNAFADLLNALSIAAGFSSDEIFYGKNELPIPGYYRAQKRWDFAVVRNGHLIAAAEFKSQVGSIGNNYPNRAEEVIGLARDFWVSYREKVFGIAPQPWLGYLLLLEESDDSLHPVALAQSPLPALAKFDGASYGDRYRILCETLVLERDFTATSLLFSRRPKPGGQVTFSEPDPALSATSFFRSFFSHLVAYVDV